MRRQAICFVVAALALIIVRETPHEWLPQTKGAAKDETDVAAF